MVFSLIENIDFDQVFKEELAQYYDWCSFPVNMVKVYNYHLSNITSLSLSLSLHNPRLFPLLYQPSISLFSSFPLYLPPPPTTPSLSLSFSPLPPLSSSFLLVLSLYLLVPYLFLSPPLFPPSPFSLTLH